MSMQPMFTIQSSASSSFTSGKSIHVAAAASRASRPRTDRRDPVGHVRRRVLLEEELALPAVGIALHRERAVAQVRDEHRRDVAVVGEQVALRDPLVRPEQLVEVRELEHALALADLGLDRRSLAPHRPPPPCPRAGPGTTGARSLPSCVHSTNSTSADELGLDPDDVALAHPRHLRHLGERRRLALERLAACASRRSISASSKPVPTLPTQRSSPPSRPPRTSEPKRRAAPLPFV